MTKIRYAFVGAPPLSFVIVCVALALNTIASWYVLQERATLASRTMHAPYTYEIRHRGGQSWFYKPEVGRYSDWSTAIQFLLVGAAAVVMYIHRDRIERISSTEDPLDAARPPTRAILRAGGTWIAITFGAIAACIVAARLHGNAGILAVIVITLAALAMLATSAIRIHHAWRARDFFFSTTELVLFLFVLAFALTTTSAYLVITLR